MSRVYPFRAGNEISQSFNDGIVTLFHLTDGAAPGYQPRPEPVHAATLRYAERRVGLNRYYAAKQASVEVERVVRVPAPGGGVSILPNDRAVTEDGREYRVEMVQTVDGIYPKCLDLTLARLTRRAPSAELEAARGVV